MADTSYFLVQKYSTTAQIDDIFVDYDTVECVVLCEYTAVFCCRRCIPVHQ